MTGWRQPMLATLTERRFSDPNWLFERKLDGMRALSTRDDDSRDGAPQLWSRNEKRIGDSYPELVDALAGCGGSRFVADGEIVAFDGEQTSFARLQARIHLTDPERIAASGVAAYYYLFDLLSHDGEDLTGLPLRERKRILRDVFDFRDPLRFTAHRNTDGEAYYREACERGWEGLIAKRADAPYRGGRSIDWLKFKCVRDQELVVGGFTDPQRSRVGFGALLVGYHDGSGRLRYAGKVGTGYDDMTLRSMRDRMDGMTRRECPFADAVRERGAHWIHPELVVQVGFTEWTTDGRLRHPRYLGMRTDKPAADVVRETS
ncbi:DNA ligase D-like protein (predicted ligase) [Nocardiopsis mwathae]|uniref:DNA ligase (ATP) n=1 Tax=Nocardiopsis mwathae TaxID=1472723 RepID=A0A7W9YED4_9ACTN|nr:non-homologous end-joining DNA ligase [Nocardiopsis mwathae]MBB6170532.1 DNA ligase D-like protein (predicted ligase) [Nocardiopsis mwathae]